MQTRSVLILAALLVVATAFLRLRDPPVSDVGRATVIDGDSLEIGPTSIRLYGVDAPEGRQTCGRDGVTWDCGRAAAAKLSELVGANEVTCREMDTDSYGRSVAVCSNGTVDLSAAMAAAGLALAYRQYSDDYVDEEGDARDARRGIWAGTFTPPWDWRRDNDGRGRGSGPGDSTTQARESPVPPDSDCKGTGIKGNINRDGDRIYHVPGSRWYPETIIDESNGERWFCTVAEAESAGWRAPLR
jgi:endonuclease YncB( thermonuclease family)